MAESSIRGELAHLLVNHVKFVNVVGRGDGGLKLRKFAENPAVEPGESFIRHGMFAGSKSYRFESW